VKIALAIAHAQIQAEVLGRGLHELRVTDPKGFRRHARLRNTTDAA